MIATKDGRSLLDEAQRLYRLAEIALDADADQTGMAKFERGEALRKAAEASEYAAREAGCLDVVCVHCEDKGFMEWIKESGFRAGCRCNCAKGRSGR